VLAQLASSGTLAVSRPLLFVVLAFANETLYLFNGIQSMTPAGPAYSALSSFPYGQQFTGLGWLGKISNVPQTTKVQAQNVTLSLSGIPSELLSDAIGQVRITGTAQIYVGFLDSSGNLIPDPLLIFSGALDVPTLNDSGETSTISITCENTLLSLQQAPSRMFDDADQQIYQPGDLGFSFVDHLANIPLYWPAPYNFGSVFPVDCILSPANADIAVGGTVQINATLNYSDGSYYTKPAGTGGGSSWPWVVASSNPRVATVEPGTGVVTGISPGECLIIVRSLFYNGSGDPASARRVACAVFVHS
jgi:hypothetical protein